MCITFYFSDELEVMSDIFSVNALKNLPFVTSSLSLILRSNNYVTT